MSIELKRNVEREIVQMAVNSLILAGYTIAVKSGDQVQQRRTNRVDAIMRAIQSSDEDTLVVCKFDTLNDQWNSYGYVYLVYGNDGWDVISDNTVNLEKDLAPATQLAEKFCQLYS